MIIFLIISFFSVKLLSDKVFTEFVLRILFLNYEFPPLGGGASPFSYEMAKGYAAMGHEVDVVTMGYEGLPRKEKKSGINIYRIKCLRSKKEMTKAYELLSFIIGARKFLKKHLALNRYDINHTHFVIPTGIISSWIKNKFGIPYIITAHGSDIPGYNTDRFRFLHLFLRPLLKKIMNDADSVVFPSEYLMRLAAKNVMPLKDKGILIRNGIHPDKFIPKKKKRSIVSSGRLLPRKGFQYLIRAVRDIDKGYELHILGDGPMMGRLKKEAEGSKMPVIFHGWINNNSKEYKNALETAAIYSLVSAKENASIALLEAMSAGCAVVTSDVSGCPETVRGAGVIIKPRDPEELKKTILRLIGKGNVMKHLGGKARRKALKDYSWKKIMKMYIDVLKRTARTQNEK